MQLSPSLRCITAPNPSPMTGAGTNTYLVGNDRVAIVDPGPSIPSHIENILEIAGDRIEWIIVTHTHGDHSPGAALLAKETGAPCLGMLSAMPRFQDLSFQPDHILSHDGVIETEEFRLRAIHTPGHVDNHFCMLLENEGILLAGDHLMNGSTVVIIPPQGDMRSYLESLGLLLSYDIHSIAPGHGALITNPREVIEHTIAHRLRREEKVLSCLDNVRSARLSELVVLVYDDVDSSIHRIAEASLWAHLIKLESDGLVVSSNQAERDSIWRIK